MREKPAHSSSSAQNEAHSRISLEIPASCNQSSETSHNTSESPAHCSAVEGHVGSAGAKVVVVAAASEVVVSAVVVMTVLLGSVLSPQVPLIPDAQPLMLTATIDWVVTMKHSWLPSEYVKAAQEVSELHSWAHSFTSAALVGLFNPPRSTPHWISMVPRHWSTSEGQVTTGSGAADVVVAASVVVSAFDVVKEVRKVVGFDSVVLTSADVALETVSVVDSAMVVSAVVVSARVVEDSMGVAEAVPLEAVSVVDSARLVWVVVSTRVVEDSIEVAEPEALAEAVSLEAVSVADSVMLVSLVVSARVEVDSMSVAEAEAVDEAVSLAETVLLATDTMALEWLSGLHFPADAMPTAAESIRKERMATMMKVGKQDK